MNPLWTSPHFLYLVINGIAAIGFLVGSWKKQWSKGELCLGIGAGIAFTCRCYYLLALVWKIEFLRQGAFARGLLTTSVIAEYAAMVCALTGALIFAVRAPRLRA